MSKKSSAPNFAWAVGKRTLSNPNQSSRKQTGAPGSPQRTWAENRLFQMLSLGGLNF